MHFKHDATLQGSWSHQMAGGEGEAWGPPEMAWEGGLQRGPWTGEGPLEAASAEHCHLLQHWPCHSPAWQS